MSLKLVAKNTEEDIETNKMFINLKCPRCKALVRSQADLDRLKKDCKMCKR